MIKQKYVDILNQQRLELLTKRKEFKFFKKFFFSYFTKWIETDEIVGIESYKSQLGLKASTSSNIIEKRAFLRMDIHNGHIEKIFKKVKYLDSPDKK